MSRGPGTPSHVSGVYFGNATGAKVQIIHYRGSGPALQDVMAGHIDATFDQAANAIPQVKAGRIRAYAVTSKSRLAAAPEITKEMIAERAYHISQSGEGGTDEENWLQAEAELRQRS